MSEHIPHISDGKVGEIWKVTSKFSGFGWAKWAIIDGTRSTLKNERCVVCIAQTTIGGEVNEYELGELYALTTLEKYVAAVSDWSHFTWEHIGYVKCDLEGFEQEPEVEAEIETLEI